MNGFALPEIEWADVVQPHQMIGMRMREEDEIETRNRLAKELQPQVRRRIDQKILAVRLDLHRLPQPLVARIGRSANRALTADDRNAGRGSRAEKGNDHGHSKFEVQSSNEERRMR